MKRPLRLLLGLAGAGVGLYIVWELVLQVGLGLPGRVDFYLHRENYCGIVSSAKAVGIPEHHSDQQSIGGASVCVTRGGGDDYIITIVTKDWNHAGFYGYVYTDKVYSAIPAEGMQGEKTLPVSGEIPLFVTHKISQHWWIAHDPTH